MSSLPSLLRNELPDDRLAVVITVLEEFDETVIVPRAGKVGQSEVVKGAISIKLVTERRALNVLDLRAPIKITLPILASVPIGTKFLKRGHTMV